MTKSKVLLLAIFCLAQYQLVSQNDFTIAPNNIDTLFTVADIQEDNIRLPMTSFFANTSDEEIRLDWKFENLDIPEQWSFSISENNYDFVPGIYESPVPHVLTPLSDDGIFVLHFYPNTKEGCGELQINFYLEGTDEIVDSITYLLKVNDEDCLLNTSVEALDEDVGFSIYPNPTTGITHLDIPTNKTDSEIIIYDQLGKEVFKSSMPNNTSSLSLDLEKIGIQKGVYLVSIISKNYKSTRKLIKIN